MENLTPYEQGYIDGEAQERTIHDEKVILDRDVCKPYIGHILGSELIDSLARDYQQIVEYFADFVYTKRTSQRPLDPRKQDSEEPMVKARLNITWSTPTIPALTISVPFCDEQLTFAPFFPLGDPAVFRNICLDTEVRKHFNDQAFYLAWYEKVKDHANRLAYLKEQKQIDAIIDLMLASCKRAREHGNAAQDKTDITKSNGHVYQFQKHYCDAQIAFQILRHLRYHCGKVAGTVYLAEITDYKDFESAWAGSFCKPHYEPGKPVAAFNSSDKRR